MARIPTRRCKACRKAEHASCALHDCYCNCAGMQTTRDPYREMAQNIGHKLCSCGHTSGLHVKASGLCQLTGCGCSRFLFDGYVTRTTEEYVAAMPTPIKVGGSWI